MRSTIPRRHTRMVLAAPMAAALIVVAGLFGCGRDDGAEVGAALDRANRQLLEKFGWGVRTDGDLEWLTQLGRGDTRGWELVFARSGFLEVEMAFGPGAQATVTVPVASGHHVHVVFRPRLGESGLERHRNIEPGKTFPLGWTSWGVSSERWGACLAVWAPCDEHQRIVVTAKGSDRVDWDWLDGQYSMLERPFFRRALGGTEVEGTPKGSLAIPAAARMTGQTLGVLPSGWLLAAPASISRATLREGEALAAGMSFPADPSAYSLLSDFTWSTRAAIDASPVDVGTWKVRARFKSAGVSGSENR